MERDYWKLREVETRYRLLFDASNDPVVLLKASNFRILEANPAAVHALDLAPQARDCIAGRELIPEFAPSDRDLFQAMLARIQEHGKAPAIVVHLGRGRKPWMIRASLMPSEPGPVFLLKLTGAGVVPSKSDRSDPISIEELVERAPDAFVIVDMEGIIRKTNQAFLDLVEVGSKGSVMGERLARWLWRPGADVAVLLANLQRNRMVRLFSTTIHSEFGTATEVEISAAGNADICPRYVGVSVRDVSRRLPSNGSDPVRESLGLSSDELGKTPLRRLVRNNVSALEKYYVKAALELANGNRTAAAVILGLSRQTLYAKLDRYGLERETDAAPEDSN